MNYERCSICGEFDFIKDHKCPPIFYFQHPDWGDEFEKIYAYTHDDAASRFAERYFQDDPIDPDESTKVKIKNKDACKTFKVHAELDINYVANEVRDEKTTGTAES